MKGNISPDYEFRVEIMPDASYSVIMTPGVFDITNEILNQQIDRKKVFYVVDKGVGKGIVNKIRKYNAHYGIQAEIFEVGGGEEMKQSFEWVENVIGQAEEFGIDRQERMVLVGGGAVLDMAGFAASIMHRGVEHIRIPTTLLSQIDAGIGSKNGLNHFGQKNFLGVFYPPQIVLVDPLLLSTLDERQMCSGMAEAIKIGVIKDKGLFELIEKYFKDMLKKDFSDKSRMREIMWLTIKGHLKQIGVDPYEKKNARPLDFGHEWGHRLEVVSGYRLNHGEAVSVGMAIDSYISYERGFINLKEMERVLWLLEDIGLPIYDDVATLENLWPGLESFRRHLGGKLTISLIEGLGNKKDVYSISREEVISALNYLKKRREVHLGIN